MEKTLMIILYILLFSTGCSIKQKDNPLHLKVKDYIAIDDISSKKMVTGTLTKQLMAKEIECQGELVIPPEGRASVSGPIRGIIKKLLVTIGDTVNKGIPLVTIESLECISIQQEYLEAKSRLEYLEENYKRQGELTLENAASIKKMQQARAEYSSIEAKVKGMEAELKMLGINPQKCLVQNFVSHVYLTAPIKGMITELHQKTGDYITCENPIMTIENTDLICLSVMVPVEYIRSLEVGKEIIFMVSANPDKSYSAFIDHINTKVGPDQRVKVIANIHRSNNTLLPGMKAFINIIIPHDTVLALPEDALLSEGDNTFVYTVNKEFYRRKKITTGIMQNGYVEIMDAYKLLNDTIIFEGIDNF